jgi:ABC-type sugar transport system ATPase subunit
MEGIIKSFPGVRALTEGRLNLRAGEVHALLGENGAGKSTLMKILSGVYTPDSGTIRIDGQAVTIASPLAAQRLGIAIIHQEMSLAPDLCARENLFLGREKTHLGFLDARAERIEAAALFARLNASFDPETPCGALSIAQQQIVEIAKAVSQNARIVVMDEPTAALTAQETERLFTVIRDLRSRGIGVVYISHRLDEIAAIADRATVLRDGAWIATESVGELSRGRIIELMVGRTLDAEFPPRAVAIGDDRLVARGLTRGTAVLDVSLSVRRGEVLGLTGLVGAGRTELARLLFGADRPDSGEVFLDGKRLALRSPQDAIASGICLLTEDRKEQGLVLGLSVRENFGLPNLERLSRLGFVDDRAEREAFLGFVQSLAIKVPHTEQLAQSLSGGNQQKVVLAKWLFADSEVLIFDEPTRGVDVGAKFEIYQLINALAARGKAILMISSELPEVLGMSDRILIMREGRVTGLIDDARASSQEEIMRYAAG